MKNFKILLSIIAAVIVIFSLTVSVAAEETPDIWDGNLAQFTEGTGTANDPYIIRTPEQLAYLAKAVNLGKSFDGKYIRLANDIYLNDTTYWENWGTTAPSNTWMPIGTSAYRFNGIFDGDGYKVYGIYTDSTKDYQGLFGHSKGAIRNLGIEKSYICGNKYVGGVCGYIADYSIISNCYNSSKVSGNSYIGGICGYNYNYSTISNSYNIGAVNGDSYIGGICGYNCNYSILSSSYNVGAINGGSYIGGICGYSSVYKTFSSCYNTGTVNGSDYVGGVCGYSYIGTITSCYNSGKISGNSSIGATCGYSYGGITDCYYLSGCAKDGSGTVQYGIGNSTQGQTTADVSGTAVGLASEQMPDIQSFPAFDMENEWIVDESAGYVYPQPVGTIPRSYFDSSAIWDGKTVTEFDSGSGTEADPYIIKTAEQLAFLAQSVNSGTDYAGQYIKLANDIVINNHSKKYWTRTATMWTPIRNFSGTFDGDGYKISGIYINSIYDGQGLFGLSNGAIKNLGIEKSYICGKSFIGGICTGNSGTISNCYVGCVVIGSGSDVGGICGNNSGLISNCYNIGSVSGNNTVGGVCSSNSGTISNCYNSGTVSGSDNVGGVCGYNNNGTISNCYNIGSVSGGNCVGGVCGDDYQGTISNCYNRGSISGKECIGGVCGYDYQGTISNCYNTGTVNGDSKVGGVCGLNIGTITNCYNIGSISGIGYYAGGVCGYNSYASTINICFNSGTVTGNNWVGGICGDIDGSTITNCYNSGSISGREGVGGVCGYSSEHKTSTDTIYGTISNSYNVGKVSGKIRVGSICGRNTGIITYCYYLIDSATDGEAISQCGIGSNFSGFLTADIIGQTTGLTDAQMKTSESYVGFDFDKVWMICGDEYPYPQFAHEHTYTEKNTADKYLVSKATCTAKAVYYYSCTCGAKGTKTFEYGSTVPHTYDKKITTDTYLASEATCTAKAKYYYSCSCGAKGTETFEYGEALKHTYDRQIAEAKYKSTSATCTAKATYYYSCTCGAKGTETFEYGDKLEHTFNIKGIDGKYLKSAATCQSKAIYYYSCSCGAKGTATFEYGEYTAHTLTGGNLLL